MEWIVYLSIGLMTTFGIVLVVYCIMYIRGKMREEREQVSRMREPESRLGVVEAYAVDTNKGTMATTRLTPLSVNIINDQSMYYNTKYQPDAQEQQVYHTMPKSSRPDFYQQRSTSRGSLERNAQLGVPMEASTLQKSYSSTDVQMSVEQQQQQQQHHSGSQQLTRNLSSEGPSVGHRSHSKQRHSTGSGGHQERSSSGQQQHMVLCPEEGRERPRDFRDGRDFGAMPPIGSAAAEFQNDFIHVFPMCHLEPQPDY